MQTYQGRAHIPGMDSEAILVLELDGNAGAASVQLEGQPGHISTWQGLVVQTFGDYEIVFRTKGIPTLLTHWWHLVKADDNTIWGMILGVPHTAGQWASCPLELRKAK